MAAEQRLLTLRLSITVADFTLDCWPNDIGVDPPKVVKRDKTTWTMALTDKRQLKEFHDQADQQVDMYAIQGCYDSSERAECAKWKRALHRLRRLLDQWDIK